MLNLKVIDGDKPELKVVTKPCRYGDMSFYADDEYVGRSLDIYGEYSEGEVDLFRKILEPGHIVIEAGANIGGLTVALSELVGPNGFVYAFEPQSQNYRLLCENIKGRGNIEARPAALGSASGSIEVPDLLSLDHHNYGRVELLKGPGWPVPIWTIDSLKLEKLRLIKVDVEGMELEVLKGAVETIARCRPALYVENDRPENSTDLVNFIRDELHYQLWWHKPPLYHPKNFNRYRADIFRGISSHNMFGAHEDSGAQVKVLPEIIDAKLDGGTYERQIRRYRAKLERNPDDTDTRCQVAYMLALLDRVDEAWAEINENLRRVPDDEGSRYVSSLIEFHAGNYRKAWPLSMLRYKMPSRDTWGGDRVYGAPMWDGQPTDKPVLISCEQGFGDMLMHARFYPEALRRAPNAFLEVSPQLYELFQQSGFKPLYNAERTLPHYDYWCALPSLPAVFDYDVDQVGMDKPYFVADEKLTKRWRTKLPQGVTMGLCWRGSPNSERGFTRDIPIALFETLTKRYDYVSLANEGQFQNFADTAACIAALELVITCDTSVAHLAGGMGWPVWFLCPLDHDWRWLRKGTTSPWYPSMRIFKQKTLCDWQSVLEEVAVELDKRTAGKP